MRSDQEFLHELLLLLTEPAGRLPLLGFAARAINRGNNNSDGQNSISDPLPKRGGRSGRNGNSRTGRSATAEADDGRIGDGDSAISIRVGASNLEDCIL